MIQVQNITKSFDGFRALDDLSFTVPHGAVYGLVGPNGAGKSTVLRCITGIYRPDAGTVSVGGLPVWENPAVKRRMAFIPDDLSAHAGDSIREMAGLMRKLYPRFDLSRYGQLREVFQLDEKKPLRRFSKGMQKQAAFWLAMCCRPDYLILDEPVDGLDPVIRRRVWSIVMSDVTEHGTTVLVSSHNLRELEDVCNHVGIIDHGKVLIERSLSELQDNIVKLQVVFNGDTPDLSGLDILHSSSAGRVHTLIIRGSQQTVSERVGLMQPLFFDLLPLTLEEIFIYELGGADYELKDIVL